MADRPPLTATELAQENELLRQQLQEAEDLITAIRTGTIDALAVQAAEGPRIFTLEGADQSYRTLIEQMNEGALLLSQDATVLYCNACLAGLLGRRMEAIMGTSFRSFVPAEQHTYWELLLAAGWAGRSKGEMPLETADGLLQPFALGLNVLSFNNTPMLAVIITDLSDKREINAIRARVVEQNDLLARTNEELQVQARARLAVEQAAAETSRILEGIPHIAWTAGPNGRNTYLNQRWFDYTGQPSPHTSYDIRTQFHPADLDSAMEHWRHCLQTSQPLEMECRIRNAAGEYRWMLARALPSRNEQGEVIQWIGTYTDIHEHKLGQQREAEAQQQLRANNEQLVRVNVDLDNFIYTASHDLKAPITNIEGLVYELQDQLPKEGELGQTVAPLLSMMQEAVARFQRTLSHLSDVIKLQKEHHQPATQVDLSAIIQDVQLDLQPLIKQTSAQVKVDVTACPAVSFSSKNLRSVVYNLLSNAVKYRHPQRTAQVHLRCYQTEGYVVLEVQDNGLGLNKEQQAELFQMFRRFHVGIEGSGIGLYMVKRMVENGGGMLTVSSEAGVGSIFSVYFRHEVPSPA
ncbi:ATP-binding protein [Hymenobacter sp. GOD-10R]|uniref:ATP-binding protein n=1 Tax=Hymenobacter sp. GOD-10R TaxID=3093922 RepID=UPI002D76E3A8|nr:ATP-binding protein [Hymenobacter sp. GOD-10R]WRQ26797.1 ATP-binding protein [Hymenobacter sp. GOD-10R]